MTVEQFHKTHPIETSDGRRWASLECAAHSARCSLATGLSAIDWRTGQRFSHVEICSFYRLPPQSMLRVEPAKTVREAHRGGRAPSPAQEARL
jgi:hypothetical protein